MYNFGAGYLTLIPSGSNPNPQRIGVLKDVSLEIASTVKELVGNMQVAVDVADGQKKFTGKAKCGAVTAGLLNALIAGSTIATGSVKGVYNESGTIPAASTYTVTVANAANWKDDLGVVDLNTGAVMERVANAPATGQYSVAAGVYTFAAADANHKVAITYSWTDSSTGKTVSFANQLMGAGTYFRICLFNNYNSKNLGIELLAVKFTKVGQAFKNEDYLEVDLEFQAVADPTSGLVYKGYTAD